VALSFAGAQRDYVQQVARALEVRGVRCFYDADEQIDLWGKFLAEELAVIYSEQAAMVVVVFISAEYTARDWTRLERRAALGRVMRERREYVLPVRFDDSELLGLPADVATVDLRQYTPEQFAGLVAAKLAALGITAPVMSTRTGDFAQDVAAEPVHAGEADVRRLGGHAAIGALGTPDEGQLEHVLRDVDATEVTETVSRNAGKQSIVKKSVRNQVFISYSHADRRWLEQLKIHLQPYMRHAKVVTWDDTMIRAGTVWRESIRQALASAKVAVLLVSPTFLASKFIAEEELPPLLEAAKSEGVAILWVPVRPSSFQVTPIAAYQAAHTPEKPLASLSRPARDEVLVKICGIIQQEYLR
jgi:TIR domain